MPSGGHDPTRPDGASAPVAAGLAARIAAAGLDWIVPAWPAPRQVGALSTTRSGGVSAGGAATLNLGLNGALRDGNDSPDSVVENRRRLGGFLPSPPVWLRQVHGTTVLVLESTTVASHRATPPVADAAVTREPGIVCAVLTADCLPVLFADRRGCAVGAAHAGWRGLARGVLGATAAALGELGADAGDLVAWLGPAIGPRAFEVGRDVLDAFAAADPGADACFVPKDNGKWLADLCALARRQLAAAGVSEIHGGSHCTATEAPRFFSHRRDKAAGRMASLVWLARSDAPATL